jgi:hypothetical protein
MMDRAVVEQDDSGKWHWTAFDADDNILLEDEADTEQQAVTAIGEAFPNQGSILVEHE